MDLSPLVERVAPSVVGVVTRQIAPYAPDVGFGSAFSIGGGLYATAYHVVASAAEIALVTPEGDKAPATVAAADPGEDLALLYSPLKAPPLPLGSALELKVGQPVVALGYPLALLDKPTATFGIVSAVGRTLTLGDRVFEFLIQTDAAINPGNSGGPLVNTAGQAVGVNSAIIAGAQGIGFAVPIDLARIMAEMVEKYGRYIRPTLGVYVAALNKALAALYDLPIAKGLLVAAVQPGSPAEQIGMRKGDIILKIEGKPVENVFQLRLHLAEAFAEEKIPKFEIWRKGQTITLP